MYPNRLTSLSFTRPSSFSLLHICLPVIWIHAFPLQVEKLSHWLTSRLEKTWLGIFALITNGKRKPKGWVSPSSWEEVGKEISNVLGRIFKKINKYRLYKYKSYSAEGIRSLHHRCKRGLVLQVGSAALSFAMFIAYLTLSIK